MKNSIHILIMGMFIATGLAECTSMTRNLTQSEEIFHPPKEHRTAVDEHEIFLAEAELSTVIQEIKSEDLTKAEAAVRELAFRKTPEAIEALHDTVQDESLPPRIRGQAAMSLARNHKEDTPANLESVLLREAESAEPDDYVPNKVTEAIGHIGTIPNTEVLDNQLQRTTSHLEVSTRNAQQRIQENDPVRWSNQDLYTYAEGIAMIAQEFDERFQGESEDFSIMVAGFLTMPEALPSPLSHEMEEELANALSHYDYNVIAQSKIDQIMELNAFQQYDFFDDDTKTEIGKLAAANVLITGSFTPIEEYELPFVRFRIEVIDIETGLILGAWGYNVEFDTFLIEYIYPREGRPRPC